MCVFVCVWLIIIINFSLGKIFQQTFFFVAIIINAKVKHCEWLGIFKNVSLPNKDTLKKGTILNLFSLLLLSNSNYIQDTVKKQLTATDCAVVRGKVEIVCILPSALVSHLEPTKL